VKTLATINFDCGKSFLNRGDVGYIDGYLDSANDNPYAVFVRLSDGQISPVRVSNLTATKTINEWDKQ